MAINYVTIKNESSEDKNILGIIIPPGSEQVYEEYALDSFRVSESIIADITSGDLIVNNGTVDLSPEDGLYYVLYDFQLSITNQAGTEDILTNKIEILQGIKTSKTASYVTNLSAGVSPNLRYVFVDGDDTDGDGSLTKPFATIQRALQDAIDPTFLNRYSIIVGPGRFVENNPLVIPDWVEINSISGAASTLIDAIDDTMPTIDVIGSTSISNVGVRNLGGVAIQFSGDDTKRLDLAALNLELCAIGILNDSPGKLSIIDLLLRRNQITSPIVIQQGSTEIHNLSISNEVIINSAVVTITGQNTDCTILDSVIDSSTAAAGISVDDGALVSIFGGQIRNIPNALILDTDTSVILSDTIITGATNDLLVRDSTATLILKNPMLNHLKIDLPNDFANITGMYSDIVTKELRVLSDFVQGTPFKHRASLGQGAPYIHRFLVYTTDDNTSSIEDGGNLVQVTSDELSSTSPEEFGFRGTTVGYSIIVGSDVTGFDTQFWGIMLTQVINAITVDSNDSGNAFVFEYWNGSIWTDYNIMLYDPVTFDKYSNLVFERPTTTEEMIDFGLDEYSDWESKSINNLNRHYIRIRIIAPLTQSPTFRSFNAIPSSVYVTEYGGIQQLGLSKNRTSHTISADKFTGRKVDLVTPLLDFTDWIGSSGSNNVNRFLNVWPSCLCDTVDDTIYFSYKLPHGISTAHPIKVEFTYKLVSSVSNNPTDIDVNLAVIETSFIAIGKITSSPPSSRGNSITSNYSSTGKTTTPIAVTAPNGDTFSKALRVASGEIRIGHNYEGEVLMGSLVNKSSENVFAVLDITLTYVTLTNGRLMGSFMPGY